MKKISRRLTVVILAFILILSLSACALFDVSSSEELSAENVYAMARKAGYSGTLEDFISEFKGEKGADGVGIDNVSFNSEGRLIITLTDGSEVDCGQIKAPEAAPTAIGIGNNGNWYINGEDTGHRAEGVDGASWLSGSVPPAVNAGKNGDLYFNSSTCDVYKKNEGSWTVIANIKGAPAENTVINEGDSYEITVNAEENPDKYAAAKALLSSVRVESIFSRYIYGVEKQYASGGAGVIYSIDKSLGDAYVITNFHVVYDVNSNTANKISDNIGLYLYGMEHSSYRISAQYVGGSMNYDIAVLKVSGSDILKESSAVAAELSDSDTVRVLDKAIAIGNPAGKGISATLGSVSVESQMLETIAPDGITAVAFRVMRIDTPVNEGNSGGGLFDLKGRLIGIVNAKEKDYSIENMGYAIPSNLAVSVAENIIANCADSENEKVIKCRLGITSSVIDMGVEFDTETGTLIRTESCVVSEIEAGSCAEGALEIDDALVSLEIGNAVYYIEYYYDASEALLNARLGDRIFFNIERNGEPVRVELLITEENFITVD